MKKIQKLLAAVLAAVCLFSLAACKKDSGEVTIQDGEEKTIPYGKVIIANLSGQDAVQLYCKSSSETGWKDNLLESGETFHRNMAKEISYPKGTSSTFDIRLIYEDGTYKDYLKRDLANYDAKGMIVYLGEPPEGAPVSTAPATTAKK